MNAAGRPRWVPAGTGPAVSPPGQITTNALDWFRRAALIVLTSLLAYLRSLVTAGSPDLDLGLKAAAAPFLLLKRRSCDRPRLECLRTMPRLSRFLGDFSRGRVLLHGGHAARRLTKVAPGGRRTRSSRRGFEQCVRSRPLGYSKSRQRRGRLGTSRYAHSGQSIASVRSLQNSPRGMPRAPKPEH